MQGHCAMGDDCPERHPGSEKDIVPDTIPQKTTMQRRGTVAGIRTMPTPPVQVDTEEKHKPVAVVQAEEPIRKVMADDVSPLPPSPCRDRAIVTPKIEPLQRARSAPPRLYGRLAFVVSDQVFPAER
ncbi:hypothetical protein OF83DRAFT_606104 [Amylostereum chailletii]|nr:hypothetical protein OF83DRAFT_606104 [Amylostereum chailletii]